MDTVNQYANKASERASIWAKVNRVQHNENAKRNRRKAPEKRMWLAARQRAKERGLPFNLEKGTIVIPELCPILKVPMVVGTRYAPSLDRIDPSLGYISGNVWVISRKANVMKNDATLEELQEFSKWLTSVL